MILSMNCVSQAVEKSVELTNSATTKSMPENVVSSSDRLAENDCLPNAMGKSLTFEVDASTAVGANAGKTEGTEFTRLKTHYYGMDDSQQSTTRSFIILAVIFVFSILILMLVYLSFPQLQRDETPFVKLPRNIDDAKNLGNVLYKYKDRYFLQVLLAFFTVYVFLQSFAIPGSIFLSILSGFLFPFPLALLLVCLCSATGASFCYLLSYLVGRRLVWRYIPERAIEWSAHVERHRQNLLNYIIFLRITPFLPNWFINIASPVINVPLHIFFFGTFLGVAPPSFVAIQAGTTLQQLTSSGDTVSWLSFFILAALAVLSVLPVLFRRQLKNKFD